MNTFIFEKFESSITHQFNLRFVCRRIVAINFHYLIVQHFKYNDWSASIFSVYNISNCIQIKSNDSIEMQCYSTFHKTCLSTSNCISASHSFKRREKYKLCSVCAPEITRLKSFLLAVCMAQNSKNDTEQQSYDTSRYGTSFFRRPCCCECESCNHFLLLFMLSGNRSFVLMPWNYKIMTTILFGKTKKKTRSVKRRCTIT